MITFYELHLSTQTKETGAYSRVPRANGHHLGPPHPCAPPRKGAPATFGIKCFPTNIASPLLCLSNSADRHNRSPLPFSARVSTQPIQQIRVVPSLCLRKWRAPRLRATASAGASTTHSARTSPASPVVSRSSSMQEKKYSPRHLPRLKPPLRQ